LVDAAVVAGAGAEDGVADALAAGLAAAAVDAGAVFAFSSPGAADAAEPFDTELAIVTLAACDTSDVPDDPAP